MNFKEELLQYQFERVIMDAQFENGLKKFRCVFSINERRDVICLLNTLELYPSLPFVRPWNFYTEILMPGAGLVILFNYAEFDDDLQVNFREQFVMESFSVKKDDLFYGDKDIEDISSYCSSVSQKINNQ